MCIRDSLYIIWTYLFSGDQYGIINSTLMNLGIIAEPVQWLSDPSTVLVVLVIVQLWSSFGVGFLTFIAGFQSNDRSLSEAAGIDGVKNRWQELWYVTLPSMAPQLMFSAVMQIAASFGVGSVIQSLAGFPTTQYLSLIHIYSECGESCVQVGRTHAGRGAAGGYR